MSLRIEIAFRYHLVQHTPLTDLIDERIYAQAAPQARPEVRADTDAYCVYRLVSEIQNQYLHGPGSYGTTRVQIETYAQTIDEARDVSEVVRNRCDGWTGDVKGEDSSGTEDTLHIHYMRLDDTDTSYEYGDDELGWHVVRQDFIVTYEQSVPAHVGRV